MHHNCTYQQIIKRITRTTEFVLEPD